MTDQTPLTDAQLQVVADGPTVRAGLARELLAARARDARARSLIRLLWDSRRLWQDFADADAEDADRYEVLAVLRGVDKAALRSRIAELQRALDANRADRENLITRIAELEAEREEGRGLSAVMAGVTKDVVDMVNKVIAVTGRTPGCGEEAAALVDQVVAEVLAGRARITELEAAQAALRPLIESFIDPDQCLFDHHGGCQAHGYLSLEPGELCPNEEAKRWIAANPPIVGTDAGTRHAAESAPFGYIVAGDYCVNREHVEWTVEGDIMIDAAEARDALARAQAAHCEGAAPRLFELREANGDA